MEHLNPMIYDLSIILILAGITSVLFRIMKQPVVLGYIAVGMLAGSGFLPFFSNLNDIQVWAEIGIIFLLFTLGLEFSFKKLMKVGSSAVIAAIVIIAGMMSTGIALATFFLKWNLINSLFLGGMLCMSSTTIIYKAFKDMGVLKRDYTTLVFGILIVEDLFAIVLMVLLSTFATHQSLEGKVVFELLLKLIFFLILWFFGGMYLVPTLLRKIKKYLNNEVLLIISIALCLFMVVFANLVGFSSALGAFIMGSILTETVEGESIEKITSSVKDLFGAIFFVSVGMMVDPEILKSYGGLILLLSAIVMIGQFTFSSLGILLSGQRLDTAIKSGLSLTQIGEFAFILATVGIQLQVIKPELYPIVVAVSVITIFLTPFVMKSSDFVFSLIQRLLPERWLLFINRYSSGVDTQNNENEWRRYLKIYIRQVLAYSILTIGVFFVCKKYLFAVLEKYLSGFWLDISELLLVIIPIAPFLWALATNIGNKEIFSNLWDDSRFNHGKLVALQLFRILLALGIFVGIMLNLFTYGFAFISAAILCLGLVILFFKPLRSTLLHMERIIAFNLRAKENHNKKALNWVSPKLHTAQFEVPQNSFLTGIYLYKAEFRKKYGISIISIIRGDEHINIPNARDQLFPFDVISVVGTDEQINHFSKALESSLKESDDQRREDQQEVILSKFTVEPCSSFWHKTLKESGIKDLYNSMLIAIESADGTTIPISQDLILNEGDLLWIAGEKQNLEAMKEEFCKK